MIITEQNTSNGKKVYFLSGTIDESVDFNSSPMANAFGELHLDLWGVNRVNSIGAKKWMIFFGSLYKAGCELFFYRLSVAVISQMNIVSNFSRGAQIISLSLPFMCSKCSTSVELVKRRDELEKMNLESFRAKCPQCQTETLEFDDVPEEYLRFFNE